MRRTLSLTGWLILAGLFYPPNAWAQLGTDQGAPAGGVSAQPAGGAAAGVVEQYPPNPLPFFRGSPQQPGQPPQVGWYLSIWKLGLVIAVFFLWVACSKWVDTDSTVLKLRSGYWNGIMLSVGLLGFLTSVMMPAFLIGFAVLACCYGVPLGLYIGERNGRVPDEAKVMTPAHIRKVLTRWLAKVGIHIGGPAAGPKSVGPNIKFIGKSTTGAGFDHARSKQVENSKGYLSAKELVYDAILRRATDIHLEPKDTSVAIRVRIDGVMYPTDPFGKQQGEAVVNIFKVLGAMDITEKRRPQDGSFRAIMDGREIDFRAATQGTSHGEKLSLRILDQANSVSQISDLGLRKQLVAQLNDVINQPHGLFVCCGPTGAGKSTTLYAALNSLDALQRNIITVEDPIEYKIDNVNQIEINTKSGQTFAKSLRSILRQDPDVVMVGEIRDSETANIACQAANTGHMVFSTIHANDTITAMYRFLELDVEPFKIANSISGIMGQRLARRLCNDCKVPYRPSAELLKKTGLPKEKVDRFYKPPENRDHICGACNGLGFRGRIGVFEVLIVNDRMRDMIREKASLTEIRSEARKSGMLYMKEEGMRLVVRGVTSYDELVRVVK